MYHHFKEIDWCPTSKQVAGTMPNVFKKISNYIYDN